MIVCTGLLATAAVRAEDWQGSFEIVPVSAPEMVLEVVDAAPHVGSGVSIGMPSGKTQQRWTIVPKGNNLYAIDLAANPTLALSVANGGSDNSTPIVVAQAADAPWQLWSIRLNANNTLSLLPTHAPTKALDDFGGGQDAGAKQDIWDDNPDDPHVEWNLKPLAGAKTPAIPNIPRGTTKDFTFASSAIFPGTTRHCVVFVPAQYDGSSPACVYVQQDGYSLQEKTAVETLIAAKEMPVTVGVFVQPGTLPAPMKGTMDRRDRDFEYDGMSDNYVRFLVEELLPSVSKTLNLKLSTSGSDRCIAGSSSGGVSAFNVAWQRPDAFSRVYANSGSFVAFRGGNEFPSMIRKFEPKPIRAYLTTGTHDMENCAGDWYLLNQEVDKALKFSGYDYSFHVIEGGHGAGWNEHFSEAMRFIWKDWPKPVPTGGGAPRVRDVLTGKDDWQASDLSCRDARSPACNSKGEVFFVDPSGNKVYRVGLDGTTTIFLSDAAHATGLCVGPNDEIYTVSSQTGDIVRYDTAGRGRTYANGIRGEHVLATADKGLYVTSTENQSKESSKVWFVDGTTKSIVDTGLKAATGLACRPDRWLLSVADGQSRWIYSYQITPTGSLTNKERYFPLDVAEGDDDAGAESVCYAREGQMLVATRSSVQICADDGPTQVILPMPDRRRVTGACLGGPGMNTLFAFCGHRMWRRVVKIHAVGPFSPWTPVTASPL